MPNLRIVTDNAIDHPGTTITAVSAVASLPASNLRLEGKSTVFRSTANVETLTVLFSEAKTIGAVILPYCNLAPNAVARVRAYNAADAVLYDSTATLACPASAVLLRGWTATASASAYAYGGGACARIWFASNTALVKKLVIDIAASASIQGYIEAARLVAGPWWSPAYNFALGAALEIVDRTVQSRSAAGDLLTDVGTRNRKLVLTLAAMPASDRAALFAILRAAGLAAAQFVSAFPEAPDADLERDYQVYGRWGSLAAMTVGAANSFSNTLDLQEV